MREPIRPDTAIRYGLVAGTVLGLLAGARLTLALLGASPDALWTTGALLMLGDYAAYFAVGRLAGTHAHTDAIECAARAGMIAGAQAAIMGGAGNIVLALVAPTSYLATTDGTPPTGGSPAITALVLSIGWAVVSVGLGAGLATIGGLTMREHPSPGPEQRRHAASRGERAGIPQPVHPVPDV
jgi:hypothetical protein